MKIPLLSLLLHLTTAQDDRYTPHSTSNVLAEQSVDTFSYLPSLKITSDIPVTLHRYSDTSESFLMGAEPVPVNRGVVLITSECSSDETAVVPEITVEGDTITVSIGGDGEGTSSSSSSSFLDGITVYSTIWSYVSGMCGAFVTTGPTRTDAALDGTPTTSPTENATFGTEATGASDYESCGFDCCANSDCSDGCCIEAKCQVSQNSFDLCADPPLAPTGDVCGSEAYKSFQESSCPSGDGTTTTLATEVVTSSTQALNEAANTTATTAESGVLNPCAQGECLNPKGQCDTEVQCLADPCESNECDGECTANYCGGCNAVCDAVSTSSVETTAATTGANATTDAAATTAVTTEAGTTPSSSTETSSTSISVITNETETSSTAADITTNEPETASTSAAVTPNETETSSAPTADNPCVKGKCLDLHGVCSREVVCLTHPCDKIQCSPDQECIANFCGECAAYCFGGSTPAPVSSSSVPQPQPAVSETGSTGTASNPNPPTASVFQPAETNPSGPTPSNPKPNPPTASIFPPTPSQSTPNQPTLNNPTSPVVIVVNVPVQTVPVPVTSNGEGTTSPTELGTELGNATTSATELDNVTTSATELDNATTSATESGNAATDYSLGSNSSDLYNSTAGEDVLDTPNPSLNSGNGTVQPSPVSTPFPSSKGNETGTSSPSPSSAGGNRDVIANIQEGVDISSGFTARHSFRVRMAVTVMAILVATLFLPGREGTNANLLGFGKVLVAAVAVSSLFSRSNGNVRRSAKVPTRVLERRSLQDTCTYNVEILYDGCTKNVQVDAPAARVIDVVLEDFTLETNAGDQCQTDYTANLTFPSSDSVEVDLASNSTVAAYNYVDFQCLRAIEGRPFVDASGKGVQALPIMAESCVGEVSVEWSGKVFSADTTEGPRRNNTHHSQVALGNEWTQRALGEHASIASFSAFSIALMTNGAPSSLVEDSLKAGLDEIRHARVSFEIASKLLGRIVEPSSLPNSKLLFGQNLTALALAVAREGCVDETLSALSAADQVDDIMNVVDGGVVISKYSSVENDVLLWIASELKTITLDESNHSALAWQTLKWVCSIDSDACRAVRREAFDVKKLDMRFQQRSEGKPMLASLMKSEWEKIYNAFKMSTASDTFMCNSMVENTLDEPLVTTVTERVLHAILC